MRKFLSGLVLIPLAIILLVFAVANRQLVTLSLDPFNPSDPAISVRLPLFVLLIGVAVLGVIAGGLATWFRQRHWRRSARHSEAELAKLRRGLQTALPPAG
jgi:uncharacterized integral membrane protein